MSDHEARTALRLLQMEEDLEYRRRAATLALFQQYHANEMARDVAQGFADRDFWLRRVEEERIKLAAFVQRFLEQDSP